MEQTESVKCVVAGDKAVGKTELLNNTNEKITVGSKSIKLVLRETIGQNQDDRSRPVAYGGTNVFILCFSISNRRSFDNIKVMWYPEVSQHSPEVPFLLVGTKKDLRRDLKKQNLTPVTKKQGKALAKEIKAVKYLECSTVEGGEGVKEVFEEAVRAYLNSSKSSKSFCALL
ncbi:rho-related GTP-binding protein RhoG-like [Pygocentrus nattereri]|uniref:rho-related GTP-binding protein RhoG-like n=1 Tax=Pygocentrus nattereri TaxID=42514 RepID=UPI000814966B|nr:rho-related GTP-binding protein RhoG-like [Pygocentrus nattereri]XP_037402649.1 rho-related GTP-binding protein RhoG-like [Pygocentrus nattereri]